MRLLDLRQHPFSPDAAACAVLRRARGALAAKPSPVALLLLALLVACSGVPEGVTPVAGFDLQGYLGKWYEIARLDHGFERGMSEVTADYSLRDDGTVRVLNRGFLAAKGSWKDAEGRARFAGATDRGHLEVSFFGPFYGSYVVVELDPEYRWALVCGPNRDYLWVLARDPALDPGVFDRLVARAKALGFDTDALIRVEHGRRAAVPAETPG